MRIGILTFHRLVNRGSVLQAYALHKLLSATFPGSSVEIIDYSSRKMELLPVWRFFRNRAPILFDPHEIGEWRRMRGFIRDHLAVSKRSTRSDNNGRVMRWLEAQGYDAIVVGSDVVWEILPRGYSLGGISVYHLPGETPYLKASFAVSMDPVIEYPERLRAQLHEMGRHISKFDFISVRDEATRGVLMDHGVPAERIHYMPDPTLHVDFDELVGEAPWTKAGRPVLAVDLPESLARQVHAVGRRRGYSVWDWRRFGGDDVERSSPLDLSVSQVLALYPQVDVLVTDRFHASILASKLGRAGVVFIEHQRKWPLPNSKGRDLFRRVGMEARVRRLEGKRFDIGVLEQDIEHAATTRGALHDGLKRVASTDGAAAVAALRDVLERARG